MFSHVAHNAFFCRCLQIDFPDKYHGRPTRKLTESYIHAPSDVAYLSTTLGGLLDHRADVTGDEIGYVVPFQGIRKTYAQLKKDVEDLASGLIALGLDPGDRLGGAADLELRWDRA